MNECPVSKPSTVDFWERHEKTARIARLTQAAATIFGCSSHLSHALNSSIDIAIDKAFEIESKINKRIEWHE